MKDGKSYEQKLVSTDNPGKSRKPSKIGQEQKTLISAFFLFVDCHCHEFISGRETDGKAASLTIIEILLVFLSVLDLSRLAKFVILCFFGKGLLY